MAKISRQLTVDSDRSVAASGVTPPVDVSQYDGYSLQTVFSGLAASASGTATIQTSLNGVNFSDYPASAQTFASGTDNLLWEVTQKFHTFVRLKFTTSATGTGTATTTFYAEKSED
jgi:hypothetical protein